MSTCEIEGCDKPRRSSRKTVCEMHYYRMRRNGTFEPLPRPEPVTCQLDDCERAATRRAEGLRVCTLHAARWNRHGSFAPPRRARRRSRATCTVAGCTKIDDGPHGLCKMHKTRLDRHGDVNVCIVPEQRDSAGGERNSQWTGDRATYRAVHQRVKKHRGRASTHACVGCGGTARHWSYNHDDPNERLDSENGRPYSLILDSYSPRCVSCHKRFDMAYLRGAA